MGSREEGEGKIDLTSDSLGVGGVVKTKRNPLGAVHWWYWVGKKITADKDPRKGGEGGREVGKGPLPPLSELLEERVKSAWCHPARLVRDPGAPGKGHLAFFPAAPSPTSTIATTINKP